VNERNDSGAAARYDTTTAGGFRRALRRVLLDAESNGVDVRGTWAVDVDDARWTVDVSRSARESTIRPNAFPATAIVRSVADREGVSTADLPPLYEAVDLDTIEAIYAAANAGRSTTFEYVGYTVTLRADGTVAIAD
jgi:hypothetical protein